MVFQQIGTKIRSSKPALQNLRKTNLTDITWVVGNKKNEYLAETWRIETQKYIEWNTKWHQIILEV